MNFCQKCGSKNKAGDEFCISCGAKVVQKISVPTAQVKHRKPTVSKNPFGGRSGRKSFLLIEGSLFAVGILLVLFLQRIPAQLTVFVIGLFCIVATILTLLLCVRRLHDIGHSAWWVLLLLVPFVETVLAVYLCIRKGDVDPNLYGNPPVAGGGEGMMSGRLQGAALACIAVCVLTVMPVIAHAALPVIEKISPEDGLEGEEVTITGRNFGSQLYFTKVDARNYVSIAGFLNSTILSWSETEIHIIAPSQGAIAEENKGYLARIPIIGQYLNLFPVLVAEAPEVRGDFAGTRVPVFVINKNGRSNEAAFYYAIRDVEGPQKPPENTLLTMLKETGKILLDTLIIEPWNALIHPIQTAMNTVLPISRRVNDVFYPQVSGSAATEASGNTEMPADTDITEEEDVDFPGWKVVDKEIFSLQLPVTWKEVPPAYGTDIPSNCAPSFEFQGTDGSYFVVTIGFGANPGSMEGHDQHWILMPTPAKDGVILLNRNSDGLGVPDNALRIAAWGEVGFQEYLDIVLLGNDFNFFFGNNRKEVAETKMFESILDSFRAKKGALRAPASPCVEGVYEDYSGAYEEFEAMQQESSKSAQQAVTSSSRSSSLRSSSKPASSEPGVIFKDGTVTPVSSSSVAANLPTVTTNTVSLVGSSVALNGHVNQNGATFTVRWFEWGTSTAFTKSTPHETMNVYSSPSFEWWGNVPSTWLPDTAFKSGTTYYFRAVAQSAQGKTVYGETLSFTTPSDSYDDPQPSSSPSISSPTIPQSDSEPSPSSQPVSSSGPPTVQTLEPAVYTNLANVYLFVGMYKDAKTTIWFEWGTSENLGNETTHFTLGNLAKTEERFTMQLQDLVPGTMYYHRAAAQNDQGTAYGEMKSFTTPEKSSP